MSVRKLLPRPWWLPQIPNDGYYIGINTFADQAWDTIFNNLSMYDEFEPAIDDEEVKDMIRERLAYLLPVSDYNYSQSQVSIWCSLHNSPMTVRDEDLRKIIPMQSDRDPCIMLLDAKPGSRCFFTYSWTMTVTELEILVDYLMKEETTFSEVNAWDYFVTLGNLEPNDEIIIRYVGSCALHEWPLSPVANAYDQIKDPRSGILADFLSAVISVLPHVAASRQCHLIQWITTLPEDEGFHELVHSALIEFFGCSVLVNRHPDSNAWACSAARKRMLMGLDLNFVESALKSGLTCSQSVAYHLKRHFKEMSAYATRYAQEAGACHNLFQLTEARCAVLLGQSMPLIFNRRRAIMVIAARNTHIGDHVNARSFSSSQDRDVRLIDHLMSYDPKIRGLNLRAMHALPFAYYCLAPWPKRGDTLQAAIGFMWEYFTIVKPMV
ncbi:hypothetical protein F5Y19DRAFT_374853 [Xylariaceae sp. FL1651]|nr:hypothetical protein F5Y19DRAFT_374853 [Xylariaceae sp. FL1651]